MFTGNVTHKLDPKSRVAIPQVSPNEKALADLAFRSLDELAGPLYERLETWSAICVDALKAN